MGRSIAVTAAAGDEGVPPRRRARRVALVLLLLLGTMAVLLWFARKPIATHYVDRLFAERGVRASYRIADLGFGRQRLTNVVIGDPAAPDLVADWLELRTAYSIAGVRIAGVRAGQVRLRGRLLNGRVSLGSIDRLLPATTGPATPFALPAIDVRVADGRMRLETPAGVLGLKLSGTGRLDDGFDGRLAIAADRLMARGCAGERVLAVGTITVRRSAPSLSGPLRIGALRCSGVSIHGVAANLRAALVPQLSGGRGSVRLAVRQIADGVAMIRDVGGAIDFAGTPSAVTGGLALTSGAGTVADGAIERMNLSGRYRLANGGADVIGQVAGDGVSLGRQLHASLAARQSAADGTPLGPVWRQLLLAAARAGDRFAADATLGVRIAGGGGALAVRRMAIFADSGARASLDGGRGILMALPNGRPLIDGTLTVAGGGLPQLAAVLRQQPGSPLSGIATIAPYRAGNAALALGPVRFATAPGGAIRWVGLAALSGPFGNGRIDDLRLPLDLRWDGSGGIVLNPACTPLALARLQLSSLVLGATRTTLCPIGGALLSTSGRGLRGGVTTGPIALTGGIGASPLALAARAVRVELTTGTAQIAGLRTRIGAPERQTRLDFQRLDARRARGGFAGTFAGGSGQIADVPLLIGQASAPWRYAGGVLTLAAGRLQLTDAAADPRFKPLISSDVALRLADNVITARASLLDQAKHHGVGSVAITHDLGRGSGRADLSIPGITFTEAFTPDDLTRLTYGVIADVRGTVSGEGAIRWSPGGVTSTGTFRTAGTDLAAAFGPVTGLATTIAFTDLLNLQSAPNQVATIGSLNPGVPVTGGTIRYRTLPDARIQVEDGSWPFAGGTLTLAPTLLDFGATGTERRMTFTVAGVDARQFVQQFGFSNLNATGTFDGRLPMIFDATGGRIEGGQLAARRGGGSIAYVGEITQRDLGYWGNFAFQMLKSLDYRQLGIVMNGPLSGEMVTEVSFAGLSQGVGTRRNFLFDRLQRLPIVFNVRIQAPFRQLIDSAQSFYDPSRLVQRNLQALIAEQNRLAGQPAPSTTTPGQPVPPATPPGQGPAPAPPPTPVQPPASEHRP